MVREIKICHSSTIKNGEYEVRYMVEFSKNNLPPTCHIFEDLITKINFQLSKNFRCGIKSRKCVKIERKKCFTSSISIISNNFEHKMKMVSKFDQIASFFQKLIENVDCCGKLLTLYFDINDLFSVVFKLSENSSRVEKIGTWNILSYGLPKVKMRLLDFEIYI